MARITLKFMDILRKADIENKEPIEALKDLVRYGKEQEQRINKEIHIKGKP